MPKAVIPAPVEMTSEKITGSNIVAVNWGRGLGFVEIGVREPGADDHPFEREFSHYTSLPIADARQLVKTLQRAIKHASKI